MGNSLFCSTMKSLVAFTYFFVFAMTPGLMDQVLEAGDPDGDCATEDCIYLGCQLTEIHVVDDWHACGQLCILLAGCRKWHFSATKLCILHDCDEATKDHKDGAWCGEKGCN